MTPTQAFKATIEKTTLSNLQDKRQKLNSKLNLGDIARTAGIKKKLSRDFGPINCIQQLKLYTIQFQIFEQCVKNCMCCIQNPFAPYESEWTCVASGYNGIKRKNELTRNQRQKNILLPD